VFGFWLGFSFSLVDGFRVMVSFRDSVPFRFRFSVRVSVRFRFLLAGVGENEDEECRVKEYCSRHPLKDHVVLLGIIEGDVKITTFMEADIFVLPTHTDNVPNVILEAMAAGLPMVCTNVGEIPDMVEDGVDGFVVEPGDTKQLADKLITLIESPGLRERMGQLNYWKAREMYSIEVGAGKMKKIFDSLLVPKE